VATVVGDTISDVIVVRDASNAPVSGLVEADFLALEAFLAAAPVSSAAVSLQALGPGSAEYSVSFDPDLAGDWILHWAYDGLTFFREDTKRYEVGTSTTLDVAFQGGTWTYEANPLLTRDQVRRLIPDTDPAAPLLSDQEIEMLHGARGVTKGEWYLTAAECCESLADGMPDLHAETTSAKLSFTSEFFMARAQRLRSRAARYIAASPYACGLDTFDRWTRAIDPTRVPQRLETLDDDSWLRPWPSRISPIP
jgi:hypothetical protein